MKLNFKHGRENKIHIYVDGEYSMTVDSDFISSRGLFENMEMDETELAALEDAVSSRRAFNKAADLLSRRDHSRGELLIKLRRKGFAKGAEEALEKLEEYGYIDDERFARNYASELFRVKHFGKRRISQELYKKGISREIADAVTDELDFESGNLAELIEKKYYRCLDSEKGIKKTVNALLRMGYSYGEIKASLESFEAELDENDEVFD